MTIKNICRILVVFYIVCSSSAKASDGDLKWSYLTNSNIVSSAAIDEDGTIYIGSYDNNLYAINPDGSLKWSFSALSGVSSAPIIGEDGTIYFGSLDSNIYSLNNDGTLNWSYTTSGSINSWGSIDSDQTIYMGSDDGSVYALNSDGTLKWSYATGGFVRSSPTVSSSGDVYFGSYDNKFYALNTDGSFKWSYNLGSNIPGSPAIGDDGTIYIGSYDDKLFALHPDGTLNWAFSTEGAVRSSPAIANDGTIYFGSFDKKLYAVTPEGNLKWSFETGGEITSSPAITSDGVVYIGSADNKLYAVNDDGTLKWSYSTEGTVDSSAAVGADGTIYFGSFDGYIYAIEGSYALMDSVWPRFGQNSRGTSLTGDNDALSSQIQFSTAQYTVSETGGAVDVTITRTNGSDGEVTVDLTSADSTAMSASDYQAQDSTITFADGDSSITVSIVILDDISLEGEEEFNITLSELNGSATFGTPITATITIDDIEDASPGKLDLDNLTYSIDEDAGSLIVTVNRTEGAFGAASVDYSLSSVSATVDSDYSNAQGTLDFSDGESTQTFSISIIEDSSAEDTETFTIGLSNPVGASLGTDIFAEVSIIDNDEISSTCEKCKKSGGSITYSILLLLCGLVVFKGFVKNKTT
ncbi:PQQ-binding-like beta-propeller repeat protein [Paraglaciecola marina]|uniref:PQQ-binding-like beta-propeller repeat protein n=1 Tax=Paraglaciecola marina TaxID=2500157 RepID=UPI001060AACB|nr:PQQ-binding-like beta-propeller repeat protein [Paraglaciecola marina]